MGGVGREASAVSSLVALPNRPLGATEGAPVRTSPAGAEPESLTEDALGKLGWRRVDLEGGGWFVVAPAGMGP
jgi:hypothetical protein